MPEDILRTMVQLGGVGVYTAGFYGIANAVQKGEEGLQRFTAAQVAAGAVGAAVTVGIASGFLRAANEAGRFQQRVVSFQAIMQRTGGGSSMQFLEDLRGLATTTPVGFEALANFSQRLLSVGMPAERVRDALRASADAASALNLGDAGFARLGNALLRVQTLGRITQRQLYVLASAGIDVDRILRTKLGITQAQMMNMGRMGIPAERALPAIIAGMEEQARGLAALQMQTLPGQQHRMEEAGRIFAADIGAPIAAALTPVVKMAADTLVAAHRVGGIAGPAVDIAGAAGLVAAGIPAGRLLAGGLGLSLLRLRNAQAAAGIAGVTAVETAGLTPMQSIFAGLGMTGFSGINKAMLGRVGLIGAGLGIEAIGAHAAAGYGTQQQGALLGILSGMAGGAIAGAPFGLPGVAIGTAIGGLVGFSQEQAERQSRVDAEALKKQDEIVKNLEQIAGNTDKSASTSSDPIFSRVISGGRDLVRPIPGSIVNSMSNAIR